MKTYITIQGDMWDSISYKLYGDVKYTDILIRANIKHSKTYIFSAGIELNVPDVDKTTQLSSLPPWKQVSR